MFIAVSQRRQPLFLILLAVIQNSSHNNQNHLKFPANVYNFLRRCCGLQNKNNLLENALFSHTKSISPAFFIKIISWGMQKLVFPCGTPITQKCIIYLSFLKAIAKCVYPIFYPHNAGATLCQEFFAICWRALFLSALLPLGRRII